MLLELLGQRLADQALGAGHIAGGASEPERAFFWDEGDTGSRYVRCRAAQAPVFPAPASTARP
jgi:hypothetical protein